jgi:hypothetical protein
MLESYTCVPNLRLDLMSPQVNVVNKIEEVTAERSQSIEHDTVSTVHFELEGQRSAYESVALKYAESLYEHLMVYTGQASLQRIESITVTVDRGERENRPTHRQNG